MPVRTVTYLSVVNRAIALFGGDVSNPELALLTRANLFFQRHAEAFLERYWWPEWMRTEERQFAQDYDASTAYVVGDVRYYEPSGKYYQALRSTTGNAPATGASYVTNTAYWIEALATYSGDDWADATAYTAGTVVRNPANGLYYACHTAHTSSGSLNTSNFGLLTPFIKVIALSQSWETNTIGDVREIWDANPKASTTCGTYRWSMDEDGVFVRTSQGKVWVEYRRPIPTWSGSNYSASATYSAGDIIYFTDGDYYEALASTSAGESPTSAAAKWSKQEVPGFLAEALSTAVAADLMLQDGQEDRYGRMLRRAEALIEQKIINLGTKQGLSRSLPVLARNSTAS